MTVMLVAAHVAEYVLQEIFANEGMDLGVQLSGCIAIMRDWSLMP